MTGTPGGTQTASRAVEKIVGDGGSPQEVLAPRYMVTTVRIRAEHWKALRDAANQRSALRGGGKPDASEVLRSILDGWMAPK